MKNIDAKFKITTEIIHLSNLKNGWCNGFGFTPRLKDLEWLSEKLQLLNPKAILKMKLYPTPEGNIQIEWTSPKFSISLEIFFESKSGVYQYVDLTNEHYDWINKVFNLNSDTGWELLNQEIIQNLINGE